MLKGGPHYHIWHKLAKMAEISNACHILSNVSTSYVLRINWIPKLGLPTQINRTFLAAQSSSMQLMWWNSKTHIVKKKSLKNSNCDKTQNLKLWQKSNCHKTQVVTKLKLWPNSNCDKSQVVTFVTVVTVVTKQKLFPKKTFLTFFLYFFLPKKNFTKKIKI